MRRIFMVVRTPGCTVWAWAALLSGLLLPTAGLAATQSKKVPIAPKWGRVELPFKSSVSYTNPVQQAELRAVFTSPRGESSTVYGFWDGGKTWRVRFSPDMAGRWTYQTICSDAANRGLNNRTGEVLCTAILGNSRFSRHGPVQVARDHHRFEHADGTPFFWLADTTWNGARVSKSKDWDFYAVMRDFQKFTVTQWAAAPGPDAAGQAAFTGSDRIAINPAFFRRLDAKLSTLSYAGLLSGIVPFAEPNSTMGGAATLPEDQIILLARYVVARWGAEPVAWLLAFDGSRDTVNAAKWKRIGQAVFGQISHRPVIVVPAGSAASFADFNDQPWADAFGFEIATGGNDDGFPPALAGALAAEWKREPSHPLIPFAPVENGIGGRPQKRFSAEDVRRAAYWGLLEAPAAGVSYGGQGVVNWDTATGPAKDKELGSNLPVWRKAMFMPAAKQMSHLAKFMESVAYWKLRPQPTFVENQPGTQAPKRFIAAAGSKDLSLIYVPEDRTLELLLEALPTAPAINWLNPRTGESTPAVAVVGGRSCQFPTPDAGDWLLVMKAGK